MLDFNEFKNNKFCRESKSKFSSGRDAYLYQPYGEIKDTIFYSHGIFMGNNYKPFLRNLSSFGYQIVTVENGGIGNSVHVDESLQINLDCVNATRNHFNLDDIITMGHSLGGYITLLNNLHLGPTRSIAINPKLPNVHSDSPGFFGGLGIAGNIVFNDICHLRYKTENVSNLLSGYYSAAKNFFSKVHVQDLMEEYFTSILHGEEDLTYLSNKNVWVIASDSDEFGFYHGDHKEKMNELKKNGNIDLTVIKNGTHNFPNTYPQHLAKLIHLHLEGQKIKEEIDASNFRKEIGKRHREYLKIAA